MTVEELAGQAGAWAQIAVRDVPTNLLSLERARLHRWWLTSAVVSVLTVASVIAAVIVAVGHSAAAVR